MAWIHISIALLIVTLSAVSAYKRIHFPDSEPAVHHVETHQNPRRSDRVPSERSIPFRADAQRVQVQNWDKIILPDDDAYPRNGNLSYRINTFNRNSTPPNKNTSNFVPKIPERCKDLDYCEDFISNYPQNHVEDILSEMQYVKYRFNLDVEIPEIAQRTGPGEQNLELCDHRKRIIYPNAVKNSNGEWMFAVNKKDEPLQGFQSEICVSLHGKCWDIADFPEKYNATCHQKRVERTIWSFDHKGNMVSTIIPLPSCCTCIVSVVES